MTTAPTPLRLFYSYSSKDESLRCELETHLSTLVRAGVIVPWSFRKILPGEDWGERIKHELETASIVLLLVSASFLHSNYCASVELKLALDKHEQGDAAVIPIILRDCDWRSQPFARLQVLPNGTKPVARFRPREVAWTNIADGVRIAAESLRERSVTAQRVFTAQMSNIRQIARAFDSEPFSARREAAEKIAKLAATIALPGVLELAYSTVSGERVAAGVLLRMHLHFDFASAKRPDVVDAFRRNLNDPNGRVRYRFVRAADASQDLLLEVIEIVRNLAACDPEEGVRVEAQRILDSTASLGY